MNTLFAHRPVMLDEVLSVFADIGEGTLLDATVGGAGHASALLSRQPRLHLLGLDQDPRALEAARMELDSAGHGGRATLRRARFDQVARIVAEEGIGSLAGALFDLGVSSHQFDVAERGFSYRHDGPLDMRMDTDSDLSADQIVNGYDEHLIASILRRNADERFADRIARAVVGARPISSTLRLAEVVASAIPAAARRQGGHPAKRTFQALRIEVNHELEILPSTLRSVIDLLAPGGRLAVLAYHSGEDRIVKTVMRDAETGSCSCPVGLPCACGAVRLVKRVRVSKSASDAEVSSNPRASSARLRVVERTGAGG